MDEHQCHFILPCKQHYPYNYQQWGDTLEQLKPNEANVVSDFDHAEHIQHYFSRQQYQGLNNAFHKSSQRL